MGFSVLMVSCGDDQSGNSSTSDSKDKDTTKATTVTTPKKKTGKAVLGTATDDSQMKIEKDKMGYYVRAEKAPEYSGGQTSLESYVQNNIEYPQDAIDNNVEGVVYVRFVVDEKGKVSNVSTVGNKLGYGLEEEAIKVVSNMPEWAAGEVKGKKVKAWRTLPVNYKLES